MKKILASFAIAGAALFAGAGVAAADYTPPGYSEGCDLGKSYEVIGQVPQFEADGVTPKLTSWGAQVYLPTYGWVCNNAPAKSSTDTKPVEQGSNKGLNTVVEQGSGSGAWKTGGTSKN